MKKIYLVIIAGLLFSQLAYAAADKPPFEVTLVIPELLEHAQRSISENSEFHVLLKNISGKPQKIWSEDCSW
ncbi:MAG: hypothetical protein PHI59_09110 [Candidatus Omnitrophica bacterium]|nr:hypothetical protein [Candidatus Omnitrophota bacterium]